ncbi:MAG: LamG-like jellyroll fold domain-containing protein [Dermatophilaceae bacterium]
MTPDPDGPAVRFGWSRLLVATTARAAVATALGLAFWSAAPTAIGWEPTTVVTGSMLPRIQVGDVVVARPVPAGAAQPGQVLLVDDPDRPGRLRLHRFVERDDAGQLLLKGDANPRQDSTPVSPDAVHGVGVLRVPWAGVPVVWARTGQWWGVGVLVLAVAALLALTTLDRPLRRGDKRRPAPGLDPVVFAPTTGSIPAVPAVLAAGTAGRGPIRSLRAWWVWAAVLAGVAALVAAAAPPSLAALAGTTASPTSTLSARYASCSTAVLATTPQVYYRFEENPKSAGVTAADSSGIGANGSYGPGVSSATNRPCTSDGGRVARLNGSTGQIFGPTTAFPMSNTFTLSVWFRTAAPQGKLVGFGTSQAGTSSQYDRHLYVDTAGRLVFGVYPGAVQTVQTPAAVTDNAWHLATATLSPAGMRLYLDGALVASNTVTTAEGYPSGYLRIGRDSLGGWPAPGSTYFQGDLDDVAYWTSALTAAQVQQIYTARVP